MNKVIILGLIVLGMLLASIILIKVASANTPQFPNVFYGTATINGVAAPAGSYVTAVVDRGLATERHYVLAVSPTGKYGSANGLKLKVGGDTQGDIQHRSLIEFFVTADALPLNSALTPGATALFYADGNPHITRLAVTQ